LLCPDCRRYVGRQRSWCTACGRALDAAAPPLEIVLEDGGRVALTSAVTIGRAGASSVRLRDPSVSRLHARVRPGPAVGCPMLEDAGSTYGTWLDGRRVSAPAALHDGATIRVGDVELRIARRRDTADAGRTVVVSGASTGAAGCVAPDVGGAGASRPRVRSGLALKRLEAADGDRRWVLRDAGGGPVLRLGEPEAQLFGLLDGKHSLAALIAVVAIPRRPAVDRSRLGGVGRADRRLVAGAAARAQRARSSRGAPGARTARDATMRTVDRHARAAALLEGLLGDPRVRAAFRHDPGATCSSFGLPQLAADLQAEPAATITLEPRESRSGLAGAMVAAVAQGVGLAEHVLRHLSGRADGPRAGLLARTAVAEPAPRADHRAASPPREPAVEAGASGGAPHDAPPSRAPLAVAVEYPPGSPSRRQIAAWMARNATAAGLPRELPVLAALSASDLTDLRSRRDDAFGFFAMSRARADHGPYAGFAKSPDKQLAWFLDRAAVIRAEHVAAGDDAYGRDPSSWHEWISAALDRRGARGGSGGLEAAQRLLPAPSPGAGAGSGAVMAELAPAGTASAAGSGRAEEAVQVAKRYMGQPYLWGGTSPSTGFDCSGLVQYAYAQVDVELPRVTHQQFTVGEHVERGGLRSGDIVFFRDATGYIHHEGLYLSDGKFLHAPRTGDVIKVSSLAEPYYARQFAGGRRVA